MISAIYLLRISFIFSVHFIYIQSIKYINNTLYIIRYGNSHNEIYKRGVNKRVLYTLHHTISYRL